MENVADVLNAVDSPWSLLALLILGFFALMWKFGKEIISLLRDTRAVAKDVQESIVTNHGSKNIGDAIDRLTGWWMEDRERVEEDRRLMAALSAKLDDHIETSAPIRAFVEEIQKEQARLRRGTAQ